MEEESCAWGGVGGLYEVSYNLIFLGVPQEKDKKHGCERYLQVLPPFGVD